MASRGSASKNFPSRYHAPRRVLTGGVENFVCNRKIVSGFWEGTEEIRPEGCLPALPISYALAVTRHCSGSKISIIGSFTFGLNLSCKWFPVSFMHSSIWVGSRYPILCRLSPCRVLTSQLHTFCRGYAYSVSVSLITPRR